MRTIASLVFLLPTILALPNEIPRSFFAEPMITDGPVALPGSDALKSFNVIRPSSELVKKAEVVTCYNTGTAIADQTINNALLDFCSHVMGTGQGPGASVSNRYQLGGGLTVLFSATANPSCSFIIDNNCSRLLQEPLNQCNVGSSNKQGGFETDSCGVWRTDPGSNGSDF